MKYPLLLFNLLLCSSIITAQVAEGTAVHTKLEFIKKDKRVDVKVTLQYAVVSDNPLLIGNLRDYYGSPSLGKFMTELTGSKGTVVTKKGNKDSIYIVPAGGEVNFTYTLAYDSAVFSDNTYAPNVGEDHVHFAFCQWMLPITDRDKLLDYSIQVGQLPRNWILYSSVAGESPDISFKNSLGGAFSLMIGAGVFYKKSYILQGNELNVYIRGSFTAGNERIAELVHKIVMYQHGLFNDFNFKFYSVALLPKEGNIAGMSISNMFLCHIKKDVSYSKLAWLMSHEMLHRWIGGQIFIKDTTSFGLRHQWFKEGINDYLAYLALLDTKLFTRDDFINSVNNYIKNVKENPYADASEDSMNVIAETGRYGVEATKLAYYKGMLIGFIADKTFLAESATGIYSGIKGLILELSKSGRLMETDEQAFFSLADSMQLPLRSLYHKHIITGSADFNLPKSVLLEHINWKRMNTGYMTPVLYLAGRITNVIPLQ